MQSVLHPEQDRILTIRECARLQGFPDYYQFCGTVKERYKPMILRNTINIGCMFYNQFVEYFLDNETCEHTRKWACCHRVYLRISLHSLCLYRAIEIFVTASWYWACCCPNYSRRGLIIISCSYINPLFLFFFLIIICRYCQIGNAVAVSVARALGYALGMAYRKLSGDAPLMTLPPKFSHSNYVQLTKLGNTD